MKDIPKQMQRDDFRFVRVEQKSKKPIDTWSKGQNHLKHDNQKLKNHIDGGGNVGVISGYGNLIVIDCDRPELLDELTEKLPKTLTEKSGKGFHKFYILKKTEDEGDLV